MAFWEAEEVFLNDPFISTVMSPAEQTGEKGEERFYCMGRTDSGRRLFIVFTVRNQLLRVISARDMSRKERDKFTAQEKEP